MVRTWRRVKPSDRSSPISRCRWITVSDIVLTKPTAAITDEITMMQIITVEVTASIWLASARRAGSSSQAATECCSADVPEAKVVTRATPMTRPIVDRVVRSGSSTALRRATTLDGSRPSRRLNSATTRGMTNLAPIRKPVPDPAAPKKATTKPAPGLLSPSSAAEAQHQQAADDARSRASTARTSDALRAGRAVGSGRRRARCAGETPRTTRDPSHPAAVAARTIAARAASSWGLNHG